MIGLSAVGRLGLQSFRPAGNVYDALLRAGLIAARSTDTAVWFVADDLSNVWQDAAGTIPCTAEGQPVGFLADQQYRASGPNIVDNGDFSAGASGWSTGTGTTITGGVAQIVNAIGSFSRSAPALLPGRQYEFSVTVTNWTQGNFRFNSGGGGYTGPTWSGNGTFRALITPTIGTALTLGCVTTTTADFDNISVREVLAQPNATALGPELLINPTWVPNGTNTVTALGGNVFRLTAPIAGGGVIANASVATTENRFYRFYCEVRPAQVGGSTAFLSALNNSHSVTLANSAASPQSSSWVPMELIWQAGVGLDWAAVRIGTATVDGNFVEFRNASVRELPGYHATQATAGNRPTLVRLANGRWGLGLSGANQFLNVPLRSTDANNGSMGAGFVQAATSLSGTLLASRNNALATPIVMQLDLTGAGAEARFVNRDDANTLVINLAGVPTPLNTPNVVSANASAGDRRLFLNGALRVQAAQVIGASSPPSRFMGGHSAVAGAFFNGQLACVWDNPLSIADPTRIAIERLAAAHSGAPYSA